MRIPLLVMSVVDRVLYALNVKTAGEVTAAADARRVALLGDDASVHDQALRTRAFAEEVADRL